MFMVLLKFCDNKANASQFMDGHKAWIQRGFDDGVFLMAGSLQSSLGGSLMAHKTTLSELQDRVLIPLVRRRSSAPIFSKSPRRSQIPVWRF